jgi:hypothetical protein
MNDCRPLNSNSDIADNRSDNLHSTSDNETTPEPRTFKHAGCIRASPVGIDKLMEKNPGLLSDDYYWNHISHIVFYGLTYRLNGEVTIGRPYSEEEEELKCIEPVFYLSWFTKLKTRYPHLIIIWSLPLLGNDDIYSVNLTLPYGWERVFSSISYYVETYPLVFNGVEVDMEFIGETDHCVNFYIDMFNHIKHLDYPVWLNLPHAQFHGQYNIDLSPLIEHMGSISKFVLNSFGYHRSWFPHSQNESAVNDWRMDFKYYNAFIPAEKILLGIDTCGIRVVNDGRNMGMTVMSIKDIQAEHATHLFIRDLHLGYSFLRTKSSFISFDDEYIRALKFNLVRTLQLGGVIVGDLSDDFDRGETCSMFINLAMMNFW